VRLLQLPEAAKKALSESKITEGHARAILALKEDESKQTELLNLILHHGWSVRQAEQFVTASRKSSGEAKTVTKHMATHNPETVRLGETLKTSVTIRRTAKGGKLEIYFKDDKELERITKELLN
jgi:ParB family chromosome partitioning protein